MPWPALIEFAPGCIRAGVESVRFEFPSLRQHGTGAAKIVDVASARETLRFLLRKHVYAAPPFSPAAPQRLSSMRLASSRLDDGDYPLILTISEGYAPLGAANFIGAAIAERPALFAVWLSWSMRDRRSFRRLWQSAAIYRHRRPKHRILILCNEESERKAFAEKGIDAVLCNHNALIDEEAFGPDATAGKQYAAVYNAALVRWKRHPLAQKVDRCAHIFYRKLETTEQQALDYLAELRALMPGHVFVNPVAGGKITHLTRSEVNAVLAQSRVGLCLSAVEGAMFASVEYLLAGLPVVSTPSIGGREAFADPDFWLAVPDNPDAVRDGVREMIRRSAPAREIRERTIVRMREHRARFRNAVAELSEGAVSLPDDLSSPVYRQSMAKTPASELASALRLER
jgi:hypothetical protein